jgi:hypothetical protein
MESDLPFEDITEGEIKEAIFGSSSKTSPGHSQMPYQVLKWAWTSDAGWTAIVALMWHCLQAGYHPKSCCRAIAVALRKPNKPDYSNPRVYHLITLLECLGKILEKIVTRRLIYLAGRYNLVPNNQSGSLSNTSTVDAILTFTNDVQSAWNHGLVTSALTFDIKGYFDFVNHDRLLCELRRKNIPLQYVHWVASFLSDREAAVCVDGIRGKMHPVKNGIPQGSPISPILAAFYTSELLELFTPKESGDPTPVPDSPTNITMVIYVDNGKIYVSSKSFDMNITLLTTAYHRADDWLRKAGLSADFSK